MPVDGHDSLVSIITASLELLIMLVLVLVVASRLPLKRQARTRPTNMFVIRLACSPHHSYTLLARELAKLRQILQLHPPFVRSRTQRNPFD